VAVDRGDDELRRVLEAQEGLVGVQAEVVLEGRIDLAEHPDVGARAEELLAVARDDDRLHVVVEPRLEDRLVELAHHLVRVRVHRRIRESQRRDAATRLVGDQVVHLGDLPPPFDRATTSRPMSAPFVREIKQLLVDELDLRGVLADAIDEDAALFGEGLGLDSLDALQIAVAVEERFAVRLPEGDAARPVFRSVATIAAYVAEKAKPAE
jgi:acyl carrier protein